MKITYDRSLDPIAAHAEIAGIHTPALADVEKRIVSAIEDRLTHLPKKYRAGAQIIYQSAGPDIKSYRYPVNGLRVEAVLTASSVRVVSIERLKCYPKSRERVSVMLTEEQCAIVEKNAVAYALRAA